MNRFNHVKLSCLAMLFLLSTMPANAESMDRNSATALSEAIAGAHRGAENKQRDTYRHPADTLNFFDVTDSMTVVEIWPGAKGWYTEILAPMLQKNGKLYAAHFSPDSEIPFFTSSLKRFQQKMTGNKAVYGKVEVTVLQPPGELAIAPDNSADRVLTFRNVHNWMKSGHAELVFQAMYKVLKPGGILGVVEHRASPGKAQDPQAISGYVSETYVTKLAEQAGFVLDSRSEINANPKDTKKHPAGVWTLPPTLRLNEQNRSEYQKIGESDRMTLKFRKPN